MSAPLEMKVTGPGSRKQEAGSDRMVDEVCLVAILFDLQRLRTKQKDERGGRGKRREREGEVGRVSKFGPLGLVPARF